MMEEESTTTTTTTTIVPDPKIVGVMQWRHYGADPSRLDATESHAMDHVLYPQLRLSRLDADAVRPVPTKDSKLYKFAQSAYRSYNFYPIRSYDIDVDQCVEVETGWALHSFPAELYTIQANVNPAYVRHGLACFSTCLDSLLGREPFNRISFFVYNWTNSKIVRIHPNDDVFEVRLLPKQKFWLSTDGAMTTTT